MADSTFREAERRDEELVWNRRDAIEGDSRLSTCCSATCASCGRFCCAESESIKVSGFCGGAIAVALFCEYMAIAARWDPAAGRRML